MTFATKKSCLSDEELAAFLESIGLSDGEKDSESADLFLPPADPKENKNKQNDIFALLKASRSKKNHLFFIKWALLGLFFFSFGFITSWLVKPTPSSPRTIEAIGEELIPLLKEFRQTYLKEPPLEPPISIPPEAKEMIESDAPPEQEIIVPIDLPPNDFSVA